jgi:uncharacterized protein
MIKKRTDLILTLLYAPDASGHLASPVLGVTRLEKIVFLLTTEAGLLSQADEGERFTFKPYKMGPFSAEIYDEVDFLEALGLVESRKVALERRQVKEEQPASREELMLFFDEQILDKYQRQESPELDEPKEYRLTARGKEKAKEIFDALPDQERKLLSDYKSKWNQKPLKELVREVYKRYPEYATKSEIKDYILEP